MGFAWSGGTVQINKTRTLLKIEIDTKNTNVHFGIIIICGKNYRMDDVWG